MCLAALKWAPTWRYKHIVVESDNVTTVAAICKGSSKSPIIMALLRSMFWLSATHNFHITAKWVKGTFNELADAGSRGFISKMLDIDGDLVMVPDPTINFQELGLATTDN